MENNTTSGIIQGCSNVSGLVAPVIPFDCDNLVLFAMVTVVMQMTFYIVACTCKFDKVTDFAGGSNFVVLAILSFALSGVYNARQIIITLLVVLWGIRLAGYLLYRIIKIGEDKRFDETRNNPIKFLVFWIFQILWVWTVSIPVMFINSPTAPRPLYSDISLRDITVIVGAVLFLFFLIFEAVSDQLKFNFRMNPDNKGKFCDVGPWKVSRHPNYFGEICVWWSVFLISASILEGPKWAAIISPIFITSILLFGSGIPPLERSSSRRYGSNPLYREYVNSTSPLIPFPPPLYRVINKYLKMIFCCEFPWYTVKKIANDEEDPAAVEKAPDETTPTLAQQE